MLKVGITGGIGSGKTVVCRVFELLGVPVFFADDAAKNLMVTDPILIDQVKTAFGRQSYLIDNKLNNKYLANIVFNNPAELAKLNEIVHPAVFRAFDAWCNKTDKETPYVLKEAALLFESGANKMCDSTVVVTSVLSIRVNRVMERDATSAEQVFARMEKQFSDEKKIMLADYQIVNDANHSIVEQVLHLHKTFLRVVSQ